MICEKCGKNIPNDAVFCSYCGTRHERKVCRACGTELKNEQLFCHVCGLKWDEGASHSEELERAQPTDQQSEPSSAEEQSRQPEPRILSGRSTAFYRILFAAYAVLAVALAIVGYFGYFDYYYWSYAYDRYIEHRTFPIEQPFFWLSVAAVVAGAAHQVYCFRRGRKGKAITKINFTVSMLTIFSAIVFLCLLCYGEGYGIHFMF